MRVTQQVLVPPMTATFKQKDGATHAGFATCPYCNADTHVYFPENGGLAYAEHGCNHSGGAVAGHGLDILIHFETTQKTNFARKTNENRVNRRSN